MSNNILYTSTGSIQNTIYIIPADQTATEIASRFGWAASEWAVFDAESYGANYNDYKQAFSIVDNQPLANTVAFDLGKATKIAAAKARAASAPRQRELLEGFTAEALAAQVAIPAASRDARVQSVITALNAETQAVLDQEAAIQSAGTIAELNAILAPA